MRVWRARCPRSISVPVAAAWHAHSDVRCSRLGGDHLKEWPEFATHIPDVDYGSEKKDVKHKSARFVKDVITFQRRRARSVASRRALAIARAADRLRARATL